MASGPGGLTGNVMIHYSEYTLRNGLRVVANRDRLSALAAVNMLYGVGPATRRRSGRDSPIFSNI